MTSREFTACLLRQGLLPQTIAHHRQLTISTVLQHIHMQIGEGNLRPVEVISVFAEVVGDDLEELFGDHVNHTPSTFERHSRNDLGLTTEESRLYYDIRVSQSLRADIYILVADIEVGFHDRIKGALINKYGSKETEWWRRIPLKIRNDCNFARENDVDPMEPYSYTTIVHLKEIIKSEWRLFEPVFRTEREDVSVMFDRLNDLRNSIMHPVKSRPLRQSELESLKNLSKLLKKLNTYTGTVVQATTYRSSWTRKRRYVQFCESTDSESASQETTNDGTTVETPNTNGLCLVSNAPYCHCLQWCRLLQSRRLKPLRR